MVDLSKSQDNETGDGTTGVVVLAGCLLQQAEMLIDKGLTPHAIIDGYDKAVEKSVKHLEFIQTKIDVTENNNEHLIKAAITALGSKIVSKCQTKLAEIKIKTQEIGTDHLGLVIKMESQISIILYTCPCKSEGI